MLVWSEKFETRIEVVDEQHKNLVALLDDLYESSKSGAFSVEHLNATLGQLLEYTNKHFKDEEQLMDDHQVDEKHVIIHKMEHQSFIYDLQRLSSYYLPNGDTTETVEKLVQVVTAWLTYHILGIDKAMAEQIKAIEKGMSPAKAYERYNKAEHDVVTTRLLLDAVLQMWKETNERCHALEQELASFQEKGSQ